MLEDFGKVAKDALKWSMPFLAMVYPRGDNVENGKEKKLIAHCARLAAELGADVVKVPYTGDIESFKEVVECSPIPVVIAGGEIKKSDEDVLGMVEEAMKAGAEGVSIGRNIFQHKTPEKMVKAISLILKQGKTKEEAIEFLHANR